jgi:hypothetical protein
MIVEQYFKTFENIITFYPSFNNELNDKILLKISQYSILIFENNYTNKKYSQFDCPVDSLPNSLTQKTFEYAFNC